ncbi:helix-turn-helix domain-containing protein [Lewinella sp. IMCC34191]|uniref:helix-turn-helix domain-containing protein n=1 Tax=Lewinella sp. IMCC34191 TaxID=2259172 RepID=UPI000E25C3B1|nr:AraC family transcriptional regulator [Lewinella sp. IMCC34191]
MPTQSLQSFRDTHLGPTVALGEANVFRLENILDPNCGQVRYSRRDFFKITLIRGRNCYHYADKSLDIDGPTLIFFNPRVPYTWEGLSKEINGYFIIFQEAFLTGRFSPALAELPMFSPGGHPAYRLTAEQDKEVTDLFEKMLREVDSDYPLKYDLLRNYTSEMIHYALKLKPSETVYEAIDASARLTGVFLELLERQFPIDSLQQRFTLRSAGDYADRLSVHVNHLNRSVKDNTGKTTTTLIAERVAAEARALLRHTDWNISEIGDSLGFREPAHFANFFRRHTGQSPSGYRAV